MTLHHLFLHNWRWKLFSLLLASAIWFYVHTSIQNEPIIRKNPISGVTEFVSRFPIKVLTTSLDTNAYKLDPANAEVTVRGDINVLQDLDWKEIRVFVDLTDLGTNGRNHAAEFQRLLQVHTPNDVTLVRSDPTEVLVRRITPANPKAPRASSQP